VHNRAAVFARRPGTFAWIVELDKQQVIHQINAISGRHYYGHGEFSNDGNWLYCTENDYVAGVGCVGAYDAKRGFRRSGEIPSYGIGPHEVRRLADGRTLVIANGGIRTHPDTPRIKYNVDKIRSNLAYVDATTGKLLHRHEPPRKWHQLSIRHIDRTADDWIAIAMQFEGRQNLGPPLVALQQGDAELQLLSAPPLAQRRMRNYCGSRTKRSRSNWPMAPWSVYANRAIP
jgi:hypothetical protein